MKQMQNMSVKIVAPARLHLGFLDMHGGLGRYFGSLGLSLSDIHTDLNMSRAADISATGPCADRARDCAESMLTHLGIDSGVSIEIKQTIPQHAGLGSGTQMSLAVGTGIARLYDLELTTSEIAAILDRGNRSGIGIGAFMYGGFIVDGGQSEQSEVPPIISHLDVPEAWRFILVFDTSRQGIDGVAERQAFKQLPDMDERIVADMCRLLLMQVLPAIVEQQCQQFGAAITKIQQLTGEYFADIQGGIYNSPVVESVLTFLLKQGSAGVGQSSWGPTGFAIFSSETDAYQALKQIRQQWQNESCLEFALCRAKNSRAEVLLEETVITDSIILRGQVS